MVVFFLLLLVALLLPIFSTAKNALPIFLQVIGPEGIIYFNPGSTVRLVRIYQVWFSPKPPRRPNSGILWRLFSPTTRIIVQYNSRNTSNPLRREDFVKRIIFY